MVLCYCIGYIFQQDGLTCFGLCHNQSSLPLAYRCEQIDYSGRNVIVAAMAEIKFLVRE